MLSGKFDGTPRNYFFQEMRRVLDMRARVRLLLSVSLLWPVATLGENLCAGYEEKITELLQDTSCRHADNCHIVHLPEPFGCNRVLNAKAAEDLLKTYKRFDRQCGPFLFNCLAHARSAWCVKRQCEIRLGLERRYPAISPLDQHGRPRP